MICKEENTFEEITIVTMCFNMGMQALSEVKRNNRDSYTEYYVKSTIRLCHLFRNVVVFCDSECHKYLELEHFSNSPHIIVLDINKLEKMNNLEVYENAYYNMKEILNKRDKNNIFKLKRIEKGSPIVKKEAEPQNIAMYTVLNHSKIDLLEYARKVNPFATDYFYWLDCGCLQDKYSFIWTNWNGNILYKPIAFRVGLHMKRWSALRKRLWNKKRISFGFCEDQMVAAFFGGKYEIIPIIKDLFDDTISDFLKNNVITSEQGIFTWMIKNNTHLFDLTRVNHYNDVINCIANNDRNML